MCLHACAIGDRDRDGDRDRASPSSAALQTGTAPVLRTSAVPVCRLRVPAKVAESILSSLIQVTLLI